MSLIIGRKPVLEALKSGENLEHIYIQYGQKGQPIFEIIKLAKQNGIRVTELSAEKIQSMTPGGHTQGIIGVKSIQKYYEIDEIIENARKSVFPLILILDSIQDPHNLGAILRSAECSGVDGVIITKHNSASITEIVTKTSAGAVEHLKICIINNLAYSIDLLKENGFWIIGSHLDNSKDYTEQDYNMPIALVLGNEEKGIRRLTAEKCDFLIKIPMKGKIQSLNVSVAAGVLLFEILRQRNK